MVAAHAIAELVEAATPQTEIAHQPLALEWGHLVLTRVVQLWDYIEANEALTYEDKVAAQVHVLDEATGSLWRLYKVLAYTRPVLQQHQRQLRHQASSIALLPMPAGRRAKSDAQTPSPCQRLRPRPSGGTQASRPSPRRHGEPQ
jgi:hypothetical protein